MQCIASPAVHPSGGTPGHARQEQSKPGAAIMSGVYGAPERLALAGELADAFLGGVWRAPDLAERAAGRLDRRPVWLDALAFAAVAMDRTTPVARRRDLVELIDAFLQHRVPEVPAAEPPQILRRLEATARSASSRPAPSRDWATVELASVGELAERLELSEGQLAWLADVRSLERAVPREQLRNYRYRWVARRSGLPRLLEIPKARLKEIQRWLLHEILDRVPAHDAAHGFTRGRSVRTHAARHCHQAAVLRLDLRDFFASVSAGRVYGIFSAIGYPPGVAHVLTGLCTNTVPVAVSDELARPTDPSLIPARFRLQRRLATPHLPQGAPTSPALANLAAFGLDRRLAGLAAASELRYSRYADDLTFSGVALTRRRHRPLIELVAGIAAEEGFRLHPGKSTLRTASQRQLVTGVVVNATPNVARDEYDRLRAVLHRLATGGPDGSAAGAPVEGQAQLRGRVAWVTSLNPGRGPKLHRLWDAIDWDRARPEDRQAD